MSSSNSSFNKITALMDSVPMLIYMKDKDKNFVLGSKYAKTFVEMGIDKYANNLQLDISNLKKSTDDEDDYVLLGNHLEKEKTAVDMNGITHYYKIIKTPIIEGDEVQGLITIAHNIDADKLLEQQKEICIATITHDLKSPLVAQIQATRMIEKDYNGNYKELLQQLLESQLFARDLLDTMLLSYKSEMGELELNKEDFDLEILIKVCVSNFILKASEKGITFKVKTVPKKVHADKLLLRRVIDNIITNAIYYGTPNTYIEIILNNKLTISNHSMVIPQEIRDNIFNKYVTGRRQHRTIHTGLGLYICKRIIELHGGKIWFTYRGNKNMLNIDLF